LYKVSDEPIQNISQILDATWGWSSEPHSIYQESNTWIYQGEGYFAIMYGNSEVYPLVISVLNDNITLIGTNFYPEYVSSNNITTTTLSKGLYIGGQKYKNNTSYTT
jgi:hypothetical protein